MIIIISDIAYNHLLLKIVEIDQNFTAECSCYQIDKDRINMYNNFKYNLAMSARLVSNYCARGIYLMRGKTKPVM